MLNIKNKAMCPRDEVAYKSVDDFRKIRTYEIDCSTSSKDFKSTERTIRNYHPGNRKFTQALNGDILSVVELTAEKMKRNMNFPELMDRIQLEKESSSHFVFDSVAAAGLEKMYQQIEERREDTPTPSHSILPGLDQTQESTSPVNSSISKTRVLSPLAASHNLSSQYRLMQDYPREVVVYDFDIFNDVKYSCGWRLISQTSDSHIRYVYDRFEISMFYEMSRVKNTLAGSSSLQEPLKAQQSGMAREGKYEAKVYGGGKESSKKQDVISAEARVWDDILTFCFELRLLPQEAALEAYVQKKRGVCEQLLEKLKDQKSTK